MCHMSGVTCQVSHVTYQVSGTRSHVVFLLFLFSNLILDKGVELVGVGFVKNGAYPSSFGIVRHIFWDLTLIFVVKDALCVTKIHF